MEDSSVDMDSKELSESQAQSFETISHSIGSTNVAGERRRADASVAHVKRFYLRPHSPTSMDSWIDGGTDD